VDLLVVGAGIVGLAHAVHALARGLSVAVVERNDHAIGASVRNFGHGCFTAQSGDALRYAMAARGSWLALAKDAGVWLTDAGTVVAARAEDEYAVLEDFAAARGDQVVLLSSAEVSDRVPISDDVIGGAWFPLDIRVDPRTAVSSIAGWLAEQGVRFHWATNVHAIEPDGVSTSRGWLAARHIVVAVGHNVDRYFPELAAEHGIQRCSLHMLSVANPHQHRIDPAVLTGFSLLRYDGFAVSPALESVRARLLATRPDLIEAGLNLMFTQRPNGDLILGDTHSYASTADPFNREDFDSTILTAVADLLGVSQLNVVQRWQGMYASAPEPFLVAAPAQQIRVVSVTTGIGMSTALGLAPEVLEDLLI
jgi:FAD dependent oxidoreductase TIGR03364